MHGTFIGSLNYPGPFRTEEYQKSFFYQSDDYVELPWLNLLFYLPLREARQDQSATIGHYFVLRSIYDKQEGLFQYVKEQLARIFPNSFLFQGVGEPLQYCKSASDILTLERLKHLSQQMIVFDYLDSPDEEMILAELIREAWRQTQRPTPHMTIHAFDYENALFPEDYDKLTWFIPFIKKYPKLECCTQRYLVLIEHNAANQPRGFLRRLH